MGYRGGISVLSKYQKKTSIEVPMVEFHCTDCGADFEVSPYYMTINQRYDHEEEELVPYYVCWCPYCQKKHMVRV